MSSLDLSFPAVVLSMTIALFSVIGLHVWTVRLRAPLLVKVLGYVLLGGHVVVGLLLVDAGLADNGDSTGYDLAARNIADFLGGDGSLDRLTSAGKQGWPWLLGVLYWVGSPSVLIAVVVNAAALSVIPLLFFHLMSRTCSRSAGVRAALLASLSPAWWLWGSLPLREAMNLLFLSVFVVSLCLYVRQPRSPHLVWMLVAAIGVNYFRGSFAVILVVTAVVVVMLASGKSVLHGRAPSLIAIPMMLLLAVVGQAAYSTVGGNLNSERAAEIRSSQSTQALSGFSVQQNTSAGLGGTAAQAVTSLPQVALAPYPWHLAAYPTLAPDLLFWWALLWLSWRGAQTPEGRKLRLPLVLLAVGLLTALAVYSGNYGTLIRLRAQLVPVLIPLAALGWELTRAKRPERRRTRTPEQPLSTVSSRVRAA